MPLKVGKNSQGQLVLGFKTTDYWNAFSLRPLPPMARSFM